MYLPQFYKWTVLSAGLSFKVLKAPVCFDCAPKNMKLSKFNEAFQGCWTCRLVIFFYVWVSPNQRKQMSLSFCVLKWRGHYRFFVYACKACKIVQL